MEKKIKVSKETREKLSKTFGVGLPAVSLALNFKRNSHQAYCIRVMALDNGGKLMQEVEEQKAHQVKELDSKGRVKRTVTVND